MSHSTTDAQSRRQRTLEDIIERWKVLQWDRRITHVLCPCVLLLLLYVPGLVALLRAPRAYGLDLRGSVHDTHLAGFNSAFLDGRLLRKERPGHVHAALDVLAVYVIHESLFSLVSFQCASWS